MDSDGVLTMGTVSSIIFCFWCGALPFSYWLGWLVLGKDIRSEGDGNPGASNVFRAGGRRTGWLVLVLDYLKGFLPVLFLFPAAAESHPLAGVLLAVAPVIGHAYSPFLRGQGGKAVTVTFGTWSGLTLSLIPSVMGLAYIVGSLLLRLRPEGWTVMLGFAAALVVLWLVDAPTTLFIVWLLNTALVAWKHRKDLAQRPYLQRNEVI